ncbi:MAG: hypothetical protein JNL08_12565 [Planctomycetes bacterium]|nr:hypothetical protein [Planctomycetota bacterium]
MRTLAVGFGLACLAAPMLPAQPPVPVRLVATVPLPSGGDPAGAAVPVDCRALALTSDGRRAVLVRGGEVLVVPLDGSAAVVLPVAADAVRAVAASGAGGDVLLVTDHDVQRWHAPRRELVQSIRLPERPGQQLRVYGASTGSGSLLALRGWFDGTRPWVALLDLDTGRCREFEFAHGSMAWSLDGGTLWVGSGGPFDCCSEPDVVRAVPRDAGHWDSIRTPGYHEVVSLPGGGCLGSDSSANAFVARAGRIVPVPGVLWHGCVPLSDTWLLVAYDGLVVRTLDGAVVHRLPVGPVDRLAGARQQRLAVAVDRSALHVLAWDDPLPEPLPAKARVRAARPW